MEQGVPAYECFRFHQRSVSTGNEPSENIVQTTLKNDYMLREHHSCMANSVHESNPGYTGNGSLVSQPLSLAACSAPKAHWMQFVNTCIYDVASI